MSDNAHLEKRLADLELLTLHYQREYNDLNQVVVRQAREIDDLRQQMATLNERLKYWQRNEVSGSASEEPPPPHY